MKFVITALVKTRDVVEADDPDTAEKLFRVKYPAMIDKQSSILSIELLTDFTKKGS